MTGSSVHNLTTFLVCSLQKENRHWQTMTGNFSFLILYQKKRKCQDNICKQNVNKLETGVIDLQLNRVMLKWNNRNQQRSRQKDGCIYKFCSSV